MKKNIKYILIIPVIIILSGCSLLKRDTMENINIVTTIYPLEYVTNYLYGKSAVINSIYPDDTNVDTYTFTDKQIKDNSKKDLFIYMGKTKDSDIAINYLNNNDDLKLIDATFGMEYKNAPEELWFNPSNLLMIAENIRNGLNEYISSSYLIKEMDQNYNDLKISLSELDADIKLSFENAPKKVIYTNSPSLKYLEKYGINVIVVSENDTQYEKNLNLLNNSIKNQNTENFFVLENTLVSKEIGKLTESEQLKIQTIRNLKNITDEERDVRTDYITLSQKNLDTLKEELY